ncbi:MAG: DUF2812 domain-containing protein [Oscillospiraceae bacterium]
MKYIVHKPYFNYEKEEKWLNEMSAKGMALTDYSWCRYVFEDAPNNEFTYRLELLENFPSHAQSIAYLKFLEENDVKFVASYMRWIYLRKKSADGEFDIYSDIDSKIKHYKRILTLWYPIMLLEFVIGFNNLSIGTLHFGELNYVNVFLGGLCVAFGIFILGISIPINKKIKKLKKEKEIRE